MHRVELKVVLLNFSTLDMHVPNAPCGVESSEGVVFCGGLYGFLMHRVELKGDYSA